MSYKNRSIRNAMENINIFITTAKATQTEYAALSQSYRGDELKRRQDSLVQSLARTKETAANAVRATCNTLAQRVAAIEQAALNPDAITADFQFLTLPVKLSENQLTELVSRNRQNSLFVKAVNEYASKSGYDDLIFEDMGANLAKALKDFRAITSGVISDGNPFDIADAVDWDLAGGREVIAAVDDTFGE